MLIDQCHEIILLFHLFLVDQVIKVRQLQFYKLANLKNEEIGRIHEVQSNVCKKR
jgi:hypothetical protein